MRGPFKSQVAGIEMRQPDKAAPVDELDLVSDPADQPAVAQIAHRAVDMDRRIAQDIGKFFLQQRQGKGVVLGRADAGQADVKFAEQMGQMRARAQRRRRDQPLPVDRRVDRGRHP